MGVTIWSSILIQKVSSTSTVTEPDYGFLENRKRGVLIYVSYRIFHMHALSLML